LFPDPLFTAFLVSCFNKDLRIVKKKDNG